MRFFFLLGVLTIIASCSERSPNGKNLNSKSQVRQDTLSTKSAVDPKLNLDHFFNQTIPIDPADDSYPTQWSEHCRDQLTESGHWIKFRAIDSTKQTDLHMFWGKDSVVGWDPLNNVTSVGNLEFIPKYLREIGDYLMLEHMCGLQDCYGLTFLHKYKPEIFRLFGVYEIDYEKGLILHDMAWDLNPRSQVEIFDLNNLENHIVNFGAQEHISSFTFRGDSAVFKLINFEDPNDSERPFTYVIPRD